MEKQEKSSNVEEEGYAVMPADEQRAVFVDTDLDTHFAVVVSSLSSVLSLKQQIGDEHFKCFPDCGRIAIKSLLVKLNDNYYHLPDTMLLKSAFHGVTESWFVFADVWAPVESQNHYFVKHLEPSPQHHYDRNRIEPAPQHHSDRNCSEPAPQHHYEFKHTRSPPRRRVTPDMSGNKRKRWEDKSKAKCEIDNGKSNTQPIGISKHKKKSKNDVSKTAPQVRKIVQPKDGPEFYVKQQLDAKTSPRGNRPVPRAGEVRGFKHLDGREGHHHTSVVQPSSTLLKDGDNVVKFFEERAELVHQVEGASMNLAQTPNKAGIGNSEPPAKRRSRKNKKKKKSGTDVDQSHAATSVPGPDILVNGDAPSDYKNDIYKSEQEGIKTVEKVSSSQLNKVVELLSQHDSLNLGKEIGVDSSLLKSDKTAKKRKTNEIENKSRRIDEMASELHLNNVPEMSSSQHESLNLVEKNDEIEEDVTLLKLKNTAKKQRKKKIKSSGTDKRDLSSDRQYGGQEADDTRHIRDELCLPVDSRPEESVETTSGHLKMRSRNKKAVPKDPPVSPVKEKSDEQIREMATPVTVIQSDKLKKISQKKQPVLAQDLSSLHVNQHLNEAKVKMDAPKRVEQADDILTNCKTNEATSKSKKSAKKRKMDDIERECKKTADDVSPSHLNNIPELLSQHESLNLVEGEKEIKEDVAPLKSDNTTKKWRNIEAKSSSIDTQDLSSKRQNDDPNAEETRHMHRDLFLQDNISRPEESVEIMSEKVKRNPRNNKAVPGKDSPESPVKEQPDEETKEVSASVTVTQSDKPKKRSRNKQPVSVKDSSSLLVNQHSDEPMMEMDAPKSVEQADEILTHCDTNDDPLKSKNTAKKRKTNDDERECRRTAEAVSSSHMNRVTDLSQHKPLNLVEREKEIEEDVTSLKSEYTAKKRKNSKAKSSSAEDQDLSSESQKDDPNTDEESKEKAIPISVIQNDKPKKRSQKKLPVPRNDLHSLPVNQHLDDSTMKTDAPKRVEVVEQADELLTNRDIVDGKNQKKVIQGEVHQDKLSEISPSEVSPDFADLRHLETPRASKHKAKKHDQASSVDTSSNGHLVESKDGRSAKTYELQKFVTDQGTKIRPPLMDTLVPLANPINSRKEAGVSSASLNDASKASGANFTSKMGAPKRADDLLTDSESSDAKNQKEGTQGDDDHVEFSQAPHLQVSAVSAEARLLEKPQASKQKAKKLDQPSSIDTSSTGRNLVSLKKSRGSARTTEIQTSITDQAHDKSIPDYTNTSRKTGVSSDGVDDGGSESSEASGTSSRSTVRKIRHKEKVKKPPKKLEENHAGLRRSSRLGAKEALNSSGQKKGLLASSGAIFEDGTSSSSEDVDGTDASSSSTTIAPSNISSSDFSEGENNVVISKRDSPKTIGRSKPNSSGFKLESILRSSSRYKKAKMVASQAQDESQPVEFVLDSQANM